MLRVDADGRRLTAVAHVVARGGGPWWRGPIVAVMNADRLGRWDVAPRAHPNDGRLDVVEVDAVDAAPGTLAGAAAAADGHPRAAPGDRTGRGDGARRGRSTGRSACGSTASGAGTVRSLERRRRARRRHVHT